MPIKLAGRRYQRENFLSLSGGLRLAPPAARRISIALLQGRQSGALAIWLVGAATNCSRTRTLACDYTYNLPSCELKTRNPPAAIAAIPPERDRRRFPLPLTMPVSRSPRASVPVATNFNTVLIFKSDGGGVGIFQIDMGEAMGGHFLRERLQTCEGL